MTEDPMHDHNLDLIMALAEGALDGADREAAEAEIAACEECVVELAAQRLALEALDAAPAPQLTELEAARMRRTLRDELGLVTPEPVVATVQHRSANRWQRVSVGLSIAAVSLLVVAVGGLSLFSSGDSDQGDFTTAEALNTTAAPATTAAPSAGAEMDSAVTAAPQTTAAQDTTAAPAATTTTPAFPEDETATAYFGTDPDLDAIRAAAQQGFDATGEANNLLGFRSDLDGVELDERVEECKADGLEVLASGLLAFELGSAIVLESDVFIIAYVDEDTGLVQIVAHDVDGCEVIATSG